jgi:ferredoxin
MLKGKVYTDPKSKVIIKILPNTCVSVGTCTIFAPNTFELDGDGIVRVRESTWDEAEKIIAAARSCPVAAIIVEDLDGNQLYPAK